MITLDRPGWVDFLASFNTANSGRDTTVAARSTWHIITEWQKGELTEGGIKVRWEHGQGRDGFLRVTIDFM